MKTILALLLTAALGFDVTIAWDPCPEPDIAGHRVFVGPAARPSDVNDARGWSAPAVTPQRKDEGAVYGTCFEVPLASLADPAASQFTFTGLAAGIYFTAVIACDTEGLESELSIELRSGIDEAGKALNPPGVTKPWLVIRTTTSLAAPDWRLLAWLPVEPEDASGFFRVVRDPQPR